MGILLLVLLTVILSVLCYLLFAPILIEIDSRKGVYGLRFHRMGRAGIAWKQDTVMMQVQVAWWKKEMDLFAMHPRKKSEAAPPSGRQTGREHKKMPDFRKIAGRITGVIRSFRIRDCYVSIDTGDMPLNGILYPWFSLLARYSGKAIQINFCNEQVIVLKIENSLARMLRAYLKS